MNQVSSALIIMIVFLLLGNTAIAQPQRFALSSPNCDAEQLKELSGGAITKISAQQNWGNQQVGYIVSLDTSKMSNAELIQKMQQQQCFQIPVKR